MNSFRKAVSSVLVSLFAICVYSQLEPAETISRFMDTVARRGQFNGNILVSSGAAVVYRNGFGTMGPETVSNIASLSKQFTATCIMILAEEGRLKYDDPVSQYFPQLANLPGKYHHQAFTDSHLRNT